MPNKALIIDACVTKSCGSTDNPDSSRCRRTLETIIAMKYKVAVSKDIKDEWNKHQSNLFIKFRSTLFAKKLIVSLPDPKDSQLREDIQNINFARETDRRETLKDVHLIEAAIKTDNVIISKDDKARILFKNITPVIPRIRDVMWCNPTTPDEDVISWLTNGLKTERFRELGQLGG